MSLSVYPAVELAKYELLGEIGHGGMATVYRARDRRLGREVAVKVIHRHLRESVEVGARFRSEALAVAKVKHPNIVEVYDVSGEDEDEKYLVVELVRGVTLRQLLMEQGPLPPEIAASICVEVCRAVAVAHREGVIHRDIKPENVLLSMGQEPMAAPGSHPARVKLTDFGIAKLLDAQGVTHTGQVLGSPAHMAPEQIEGGDVDARSDIFGIGVLLYEMLTGVLPFEGKNPAQVLRKVLEGVFLPAERQLPRVGSAYGQIAAQALAHLPGDRFPSASVMGAELEAELASLGIAEVRAEISLYLNDPGKYRIEHDKSHPDVLGRVAAEARAAGDVVRAAALFNRALAYRPDDTRLLSEVAGLARRGRLRRQVWGLALGATILGMLGISGYYAFAYFAAQDLSKHPTNKNQSVDTSLILPRAFKKQLPPTAQNDEIAATKPGAQTGDEARVTRRQKPSVVGSDSPPAGQVTRGVRTPVVGPQNARVRIDGVLVTWFQRHELTLGAHTFEFVAPNAECCEASSPLTVVVTPGEGDQVVRGVIAFRPAVLRLEGPEGTRASCGVGGVLVAGGSKEVPMNRASRTLSCTVFPPPNHAGEPKQIDVDLRPGRTFTLTGA